MTSRDVVGILSRRVRPLKVGHCGTLDPLAEGVLVLGVGRASRLTEYVQLYSKSYSATFRLGQSSDSGDLEQPLTEHPHDPKPSREALESAALAMTGCIKQTPSAYSAIWVDGKRAWERVRKGEKVEMPSRMVEIHSIEITRYEYPKLDVYVHCGSGTYVRSLGVDLASHFGGHAVMTRLLRTKVGPFSIETAVSLDAIKSNPIEPMIQPANLGVMEMPQLQIDAHEATRLLNGLDVEFESSNLSHEIEDAVAAAVRNDGRLIAIVRKKTKDYGPLWYPEKVFPESDSS